MVPFLVPLEDVLETSQHSLETVPVNRGHSDSVDRLYAGLSVDIVHQGKLPEVVALLVLENHPRELIMNLFLLSHEIPL